MCGIADEIAFSDFDSYQKIHETGNSLDAMVKRPDLHIWWISVNISLETHEISPHYALLDVSYRVVKTPGSSKFFELSKSIIAMLGCCVYIYFMLTPLGES